MTAFESPYRVLLCTHRGCGHPGGQHYLGATNDNCRLCDVCPGWHNDHTEPGWWSNERQHAAESAR